MNFKFPPDKPIRQQHIDRIVGDIIRGELKTGEKLPSVREYAVEVGVNANTMQRVYKELEKMQITKKRRGRGSFVTENKEKITVLRNEMKDQLMTTFLQNVATFGFTTEEIIKCLQGGGKNLMKT